MIQQGNMELVCVGDGKTINNTPYSKYKILPTGLTVTIIEHDGPIISGDILLKTLVDDNDGLPHTLEHLIFLGSSSYPKGFLDLASNRCLAKGTNAMTDQDHTVYTVSCAGKDGFLSFLPIFLDHILFPLLTDEVYTTEVHHVSGDGDDAGVVYCEMQTYENTMDLIAERSFTKQLYGENHVYSVETGGMLENLRTSCNNEKCKQFHKQFYTADNMDIIIGGKVTIKEVMKAIEIVHQKILNDKFGDYRQPLPTMNDDPFKYRDVRKLVTQFPSPADDDPGLCLMGFVGPHISNPLGIIAEDILIDYLIDTPISPLTQHLVHIDEPYCSSISAHRYKYSQTVVQLKFNDTDSHRHEDINKVVKNVLNGVLESGLDSARLETILKNTLSSIKMNVENHDLNDLISVAYLDHLYGSHNNDILNNHLLIEEHYQSLLDVDTEFWQELLKKFINSLKVVVVAQPSYELLNKFEMDEETRIEERKKMLGEKTLLQYAEKLSAAEKCNNNTIDPSLFDEIPKPAHENLSYYWNKSTVWKSESLNSRSLLLHNIASEYYQFYFIVSLSDLSDDQKLYLPLICELFCKLPVEYESACLDETEVSSTIEQLFFSHDISIDELFREQLTLSFVFRESDVMECLRFLNLLLFHQVVLTRRVKECIVNLKSTVKASERCGYETMQSLVYESFFPASVAAQSGLRAQAPFLDRSIQDVSACCKNVQTVLDSISKSGFYLHVVSNETLLGKLDQDEIVKLFNLEVEAELKFNKLQSYFDTSGGLTVKTVPGEESSYLTSAIPVSTLPLDETDIKMKVFQYWFGQLDGVVGREIRGKGLAYHFFIRNYPDDGVLIFQLQQSSDIPAAYNSVKQIISEMMAPSSGVLDEHQVDLARSAVCYSFINEVRSPLQRVFKEIKHTHRGESTNKDFSSVLQILDAIDCNSIVQLCRDYQSKLLDSEKSVVLVTLPPTKAHGFVI